MTIEAPKQTPCTGCDKPCESPYNEDGECLKTPSLAQLVVLGGEKIADLITKLTSGSQG